jgi:beta-lactamase regulating signal transducer with metallopeptidase domain
MSKFQSTVSTLAAFASIAVTTVGVYKAVENNKQHAANQQKQIEQLKTQLKQKSPQVQPQVEQPLAEQPLEPIALPPVDQTSVSSLPIRQ